MSLKKHISNKNESCGPEIELQCFKETKQHTECLRAKCFQLMYSPLLVCEQKTEGDQGNRQLYNIYYEAALSGQ